jgi:Flp pilus assembly pilin Flp
MSELRRFFMEEEGEIVEWAVFMLILLAFTVAIIIAVGGQAQQMWDGITQRIQSVLDAAAGAGR